MASKNSIGAIALDLQINGRDYQRQVNNVAKSSEKSMSNAAAGMENSFKSSFSRIGKMAIAAFSVAAIGNFIKSCLDLGSALTEVQNVVDVSFPTMSGQIDAFAKNAMTQFGLSETIAKRYAGTFGSMAQAFKFTEAEAAEMATTLTGLAGDVASFYNMDADLAYTKLKSVFSGETETLKDLGIVMTQTALDEYALSKGIGNATSAMSEQEKVMLRYQFVQDQLKFATGDFARTQDSWANQTRVLTLRWESFKASIGKGLIALFTPIIKGINWVLSNLQVLADSFASLMEMLTGYSGDTGSGGLATATDDLGGVTDAADSAGESVGSVGDGASAAAKKIQKAFAKVDTINKLTFGSDSDSGSGSGSSGGSGASSGSVADAVDFPDATKQATVFDGMLKGLIDEFKRLSSIFVDGFKIGFGDSFKDLDRLKDYIFSIGDSLADIFTDPKVTSAFSKMIDSFVFMWGSSWGALASIGTTVATLIVGSIATYLQNNTGKIKDFLVSMFNIRTDINNILAIFYQTIAEIARVFASPTAIAIGANLIQAIMDGVMGTLELLSKMGRDILDTITAPIIENKDKIINALSLTLEPIRKITESIAEFIENTFSKIQQTYDKYVKPTFEKIKKALSSILGTILDNYNEYIAPVIDYIAVGFGMLMEQYIQPLINSILDFIGHVVELGGSLIELLTPFVNFLINKVAPIVATVIKVAWDLFSGMVALIAEGIKVIVDTLTGIIDFLNNVFTGNWEQIWTNIKNFFAGIWEWIKQFVSGIINSISIIISGVLNGIKNVWNGIWSGIGTFVGNIWEGIKKGVSDKISNVKTAISTVLNTIKGIWERMWNGLATFVQSTWNWILRLFNGGGKIFDGVVGGIADVFKTIVNGLVTGINNVIAIPFNIINGILNGIKEFSVLGQEPFYGLWGYNPLPVPQLPYLAQGGYVKANTPQLAMIGDNRHQGEVVAPEGKMVDMINTALSMQKESGSSEGIKEVIILLKKLIVLVSSLYLSADIDLQQLSISLKQAEKDLSMIGG